MCGSELKRGHGRGTVPTEVLRRISAKIGKLPRTACTFCCVPDSIDGYSSGRGIVAHSPSSVMADIKPVSPGTLSLWKRYGPSEKTVRGIVIGGITGGIEVCITFPTEYVKTQLQLDERSATPKYKGPIDCVKQTVRNHGFFGLYRGLSVLIYGSIPKSSFRFGTFEFLKSKAVDERGNLPPIMRLFCGLGAGLSEAVFAVTPMETVKVKFIHDQIQPKPRFKGFLHGVGCIIKSEGIGGIYKGVTATMAKQGSNQAIRFFVMETLKDWYRGGDSSKTVSKPVTGLMGAFAGLCSVYGNTPIDVVKTRMQGLEAKKYKNSIDCAVQIWKKEGFFAFYKGTVPRLSRVVLDVAITFMIYDSIMDFLNKYWRKPAD